jgi:hypothetical protein
MSDLKKRLLSQASANIGNQQKFLNVGHSQGISGSHNFDDFYFSSRVNSSELSTDSLSASLNSTVISSRNIQDDDESRDFESVEETQNARQDEVINADGMKIQQIPIELSNNCTSFAWNHFQKFKVTNFSKIYEHVSSSVRPDSTRSSLQF